MTYSVVISRDASRELQRLPKAIAKRVLSKLEKLRSDPRPVGCQKLASYVDLWRVRIGDYRAIYRVDDSQHIITVLRVRHRSSAYDEPL